MDMDMVMDIWVCLYLPIIFLYMKFSPGIHALHLFSFIHIYSRVTAEGAMALTNGSGFLSLKSLSINEV